MSSKDGWHRKARWMIKNVLIKPPTTPTEMKDLCNTIIEKRNLQIQCSSSKSIVTTALSLWDDPNLVNALQNNAIFQNAQERIERTANHLLPGTSFKPISPSSEFLVGVNQSSSMSDLQFSVEQMFNEAFSCPVCGKNLQCSHEHYSLAHSHSHPHNHSSHSDEPSSSSHISPSSSSSLSPSSLFAEFEEDKKNKPLNESTGNAGSLPNMAFSGSAKEKETTSREQINPNSLRYLKNLNLWFGPLVLASLAVAVMAYKIFNGEIHHTKLKSASSRTFAAISMLLQTSNSVTNFIDVLSSRT